jgi:hypothetical protein
MEEKEQLPTCILTNFFENKFIYFSSINSLGSKCLFCGFFRKKKDPREILSYRHYMTILLTMRAQVLLKIYLLIMNAKKRVRCRESNESKLKGLVEHRLIILITVREKKKPVIIHVSIDCQKVNKSI